MAVFHIEIKYLTKVKEEKKVTKPDNITALTHVLNSLSLDEKNNVMGLKVTRVID